MNIALHKIAHSNLLIQLFYLAIILHNNFKLILILIDVYLDTYYFIGPILKLDS